MGYETGFNATYASILEGAKAGDISPEQAHAVASTFICKGPDDRYADTAQCVAALKTIEPTSGLSLELQEPEVIQPLGGAQPS
ncbi:MAG: hypothetical protein CL570_06175 [Alphaproteobacteria bacterium]|nr:hypothetical protein [Alphaproteobacteria bacterium]|tara:strand:- start:2277 stop:2525 length:249 start_codon:yes stop_codon:yes gene_type:complete